jgi:hypothetical protein
LAEQYRGKVDFYAVYILEAHPTDVWEMQSNVQDKVLFRMREEAGDQISLCH